jgi:protein phosphatase 1L
MEDTFQARNALDGDSSKAFFGVFDGHGGDRVSAYIADTILKLLAKQPINEFPTRSLVNVYKKLDEGWLSQAVEHGWDDGSTAVSALIVNGNIYVANVGDSRCVLSQNGKAVAMSVDHKPNREDEKIRIQSLGGRIIYYGTWRVEGILALTRAIGDKKLKRFITSVPEIKCRRIRKDDHYLIMASDGVWDVLTNQNAVDVVNQSENVKAAAKNLTSYAYNKGSSDNITSLVIDLRPYYKPDAANANANANGHSSTSNSPTAACDSSMERHLYNANNANDSNNNNNNNNNQYQYESKIVENGDSGFSSNDASADVRHHHHHHQQQQQQQSQQQHVRKTSGSMCYNEDGSQVYVYATDSNRSNYSSNSNNNDHNDSSSSGSDDENDSDHNNFGFSKSFVKRRT